MKLGCAVLLSFLCVGSWFAWRSERALGNAELGVGFEGLPQGLAIGLAAEKFLVGAEDGGGFGGVFFEEFDAEVAESGFVEFGEMGGSCLRFSVEEGVAAADISA